MSANVPEPVEHSSSVALRDNNVATVGPAEAGSAGHPILVEDDDDDDHSRLVGSSAQDKMRELLARSHHLENACDHAVRTKKDLRRKLDDALWRNSRMHRQLQQQKGPLQGLPAKAKARKRWRKDSRQVSFEELLRQRSHLQAELNGVRATVASLRKREGYECAICSEKICNTITFCGHLFCEECFESWCKRQKEDRKPHTCPFCRAPLAYPPWSTTLPPLSIRIFKT